MPQVFHSNEHHSLGVELELMLIDQESGALANAILDILPQVPEKWQNSIKPEFMQSYCEINSGVCRTVRDVEMDLSEKLNWLQDLCERSGMTLAWSGTHPFSRWDDQKVTPGERYAWLLQAMQDVARRLLIFGLHVHVGVDSGDKAIHMCDRLLRHIPVLLALSANSPYWCGRDSGMESYRSKIIEALPTAGMPHTMRNWSEYVWLIDHLIATKFISSNREIWWDVRPHAGFGTVEMRVMDMPLNMKHCLGLVALTQSLVAAISDHIDKGQYLYDCHPMIAKQNKWHAGRYGMDATFVDHDTMKAVPARQVARKLIELVSPYADALGCLKQLYFLDDIIEHGTGAFRQKQVFRQTNSLRAVVDMLVAEATNNAVAT